MKKSWYTAVVLVTVSILLLAVAISLLTDFTSAKKFSDLCQDIEQFDSCKILCIMVDREEEVILTGDVLNAFISQLEQQEYIKRGSYGNTMEGTIYHLYFYSTQVDSFEMKVSDSGKVYIGSNYYDLSPDVDPDAISSYIEALLK